MTTTLRLELSEDQRAALHLHLAGKNGKATRSQIVEWATALITKQLRAPDKEVATGLQNIICPKCSRPIAVPVPRAARPVRPASMDKARVATEELARALQCLAKELS